MTFPNQKYGSPNDYIDAYFENHSKAVSSVNKKNVAEAVAILQKLYESDRTLYVCGNGGSASISNHLACDHGKLLATDTDLLPHIHSLAANIEVITAIANDISRPRPVPPPVMTTVLPSRLSLSSIVVIPPEPYMAWQYLVKSVE